MKVKSIKFTDHVALGNYQIDFQIVEGPQVNYLVGNNGSGKTHILSSIYSALSGSDGGISQRFSMNLDLVLDGQDLAYAIHDGGTWWDDDNFIVTEQLCCQFGTGHIDREIPIASKDRVHGGFGRLGSEPVCPVAYSEVGVDFRSEKVRGATALEADDIKPSEKSDNLNTLIPQLLVDIQTDDNARVADFVTSSSDLAELQNLPLVMPRFSDAYNRIMKGNKQFGGVEKPKGGHGYDILFKDSSGAVIDLSDLSSGEKQVIYRLGFILKNLKTLQSGIILIDEPEIGLHPEWQIRFKQLLMEIFKDTDVQIIIATHSPYIFKDFDKECEECILINRNNASSEVINLNIGSNIESPSPNFMSYKAFGLVDENLHIELYARLMIHSGITRQDDFNDWLSTQGVDLPKLNRSKTGAEYFAGRHVAQETLPVWIRNKLHHPEIEDRKEFGRDDLKESIDKMIALLERSV